MGWNTSRFINADGQPSAHVTPLVNTLQAAGAPVLTPSQSAQGRPSTTTAAPLPTGRPLDASGNPVPITSFNPTTPAAPATPAGQVDARAGNPTGNTNTSGQVWNADSKAYEAPAAGPTAPIASSFGNNLWGAAAMTGATQDQSTQAQQALMAATGGPGAGGYAQPGYGAAIEQGGLDPNMTAGMNALRQGLSDEQVFNRVTGADGTQGNGMQGMSKEQWMQQIASMRGWMGQNGVSGGGATGFAPGVIAAALQRAGAAPMGPGGQVIPPPYKVAVDGPGFVPPPPPQTTYGYGPNAFEAPPGLNVNYGR